MDNTERSSLKIAIIGAGPAGCTLARLLAISPTLAGCRKLVSVTIFEREQNLHDRDQGGTLDLHEESGLTALRACGLDDDRFQSMARYDGDAMLLVDKNMHPWLSLASSTDGGWIAQRKPEVDRLALRKLLLDSLPADFVTVIWGRSVVQVQEQLHEGHDLGSVKHTLHFDDASEIPGFDLVVGCDGANSILRPLITPHKPFYTGVGGWNMLCLDAEKTRPLLKKLVNRGSFFAYSDGQVVMAQQLGTGDLYLSVWGVKSEHWMSSGAAAGYDVYNPKAVKTALLDQFKDWAPEIREVIASFDETRVWPRSIVQLPTGITWKSRPGVTILGDAAHVMCPFMGEGVNAAMMDAMQLSEAIITAVVAPGKSGPWNRGTLVRNVQEFETIMQERVHKKQKISEDMMRFMLFTPGAPATTIEKYVVRAATEDKHPIVASLLALLIYLYYFIERRR